MKHPVRNRRIESFLIVAVLLTVNALVLLWMQGRPIASVLASELAAPAAAPQAAVTIPTTFSYQGTLRDANGDLINGAVNLTLKIHSAVIGGNALHSESYANVNVRNGLFSVIVGDANPIASTVFDTYPLYLGLSVNQDPEMLPRQRLHPVPYAMQSSSAQTAVTANNLAAGGGVPNLVTLGAAGASEIGFAPNGGKITNSAGGLTLNGGANPKVSTVGALAVGGDLTVDGDWSAGAIHDVGNSQGGATVRSTYPVSINRYVVEAPDQGASPDTVVVDDAILTQFCQDEDGCSVSLYMRNWAAANEGGLLAGAGPFRMSLAPAAGGKRHWAIYDTTGNAPTLGFDKDGSVGHLMSVFGSCFFTDGEHNNAVGSDGEFGFGLLNWFGAFSGAYDSTNMTCVLIIED